MGARFRSGAENLCGDRIGQRGIADRMRKRMRFVIDRNRADRGVGARALIRRRRLGRLWNALIVQGEALRAVPRANDDLHRTAMVGGCRQHALRKADGIARCVER